jgi:hypothetical protein
MCKEEIKALIEGMCDECTLFRGNFDGANGSLEYMYGIGTVMAHLANMVSDEYGADFYDQFIDNLIDSVDKKDVDNNA